jgi:iron-sulfur cluster assembly accessory protein
LAKNPQEIEENDIILDAGEGKFVVGTHSVMFLIGTTVDYKKDIMGAMFDIINPNAQSSCGCGVSVNFDMDKLASPAI